MAPAAAARGSVERAIRASTRSMGDAAPGTLGEVWIHEQGALRRVSIRIGLSDGSQTELLSGALDVGAQVVIGVTLPGAASAAAAPSAPANRSIFGGGATGRGGR
jgi:hypothetical protein